MASNTTLNSGAGGDVIATKERTHDGDATKVQVVTVAGVTGSEGSYTFTDVTAGGGVEATALRVTLASDSTGVLSVDDNGGSLTVDGTVELGSTTLAALESITVVDGGSTISVDDGGGALTVDGTVELGATSLAALETINAAQSGTWTARLADGAGNALTSKAPGSDRALSVAIVDGAGNQVTSFGGSGGTSATDDAAFTAGSGSGTPMMAFATSDSVDSGDVGVVAMTTGRALHVSVQGTAAVSDGGGSLTVDGTVELGSTSLAALESLTTISTVTTVGAVTAITNALPAGSNNIGDVDVLSVVPGTGATNLGKAEDAPHSSGDTGVMSLAVRRDADTTLVSADGDYSPLQVNASGSLKVAITSGAGSGGTSIADGASFTRDTTSITPAGAVVESSAPTLTNGDVAGLSMTTGGALRVAVASGGVSGILEDAASAGGEEGIMMLAVRRDSASSGVSADGDFAALSVTSDGSLRVSGGGGGTQYAVDTAGGGTDTGTLSLAVRDDALATLTPIDGDYTQLRTNARGAQWVCLDSTAAQTVTLAAGTATNEVVGDAAHDAAAAGNPLLQGGYASAAAPTDVSADGDVVRAWHLRNGAQATVITAAGALVGGDATNGLDVDVTRVSGTVTVGGTAAADAAVSGNPVYVAGRGSNTTPTAMSAQNDVTPLWLTLTGASVVAGDLVDDAAFTPGTSRVQAIGLQADETATDSIDEGDIGAPRMTLDRKQIITQYAHAAAGGGTPFRNIDVDETEDDVKTSAGKLYSLHVINLANAKRYLKIYDSTAASVTVGTTVPVLEYPIPTMGDTNGAGFVIDFGPVGVQFATGICIAATTGLGHTDTGAPGSNEVVVNGVYA